MKIHYYIDWFIDTMPEQVAELLRNDIPDRKSLVLISALPSDYEKSGEEFDTVIKAKWLDPACIIFDEYHLIDYRTAKEEAHKLLKSASAIFLLGGHPAYQNVFMAEYDLSSAIMESNAHVIMGFSAGTMNMSAHWVSFKRMEEHSNGKIKAGTVYDGLNLDNFAVKVHYEPDNADPFEDELLGLSRKMDVYVMCYESVIRSKNGKLDIMGDVYLISDSKIRKVEETDFAIDEVMKELL